MLIDHKNPNSAHSGLIHLWAWLRYTDLSPQHKLWHRCYSQVITRLKNYLHLPFRLRLNFSTNNNHHTVLCQKFTSLREGLLFLSYDMFVERTEYFNLNDIFLFSLFFLTGKKKAYELFILSIQRYQQLHLKIATIENCRHRTYRYGNRMVVSRFMYW